MNSWQTLDIIARTEHRSRTQRAEERYAVLAGLSRQRQLERLRRWVTGLGSMRAPAGKSAVRPKTGSVVGPRDTKPVTGVPTMAGYRRQH